MAPMTDVPAAGQKDTTISVPPDIRDQLVKISGKVTMQTGRRASLAEAIRYLLGLDSKQSGKD
jgi:hypothetical protein